MTFQDFEQKIVAHLPQGATIQYGYVGARYLVVLVPTPTKIVKCGKVIYDFWNKGLWLMYPELVEQFAVAAAAKFAVSYWNEFGSEMEESIMPSIHYNAEGKLALEIGQSI